MKLRYYLIPMEKAAAWQVVDGELDIDLYNLNEYHGITTMIFCDNTERDEWIAAVHKHLADWAYGKE